MIKRWLTILFFAGILILAIGFQLQLSFESNQKIQSTLQYLQSINDSATLDVETRRQQLLSIMIQNEESSIAFAKFVSSLSTVIGIIVTIVGLWTALSQYLEIRRKEAADKERQRAERIEQEYTRIWERLTDADPNMRAASITALQQFLTDDHHEFHERAISALALAGRTKNENIIEQTLTPVVEYAFHHLPDKVRNYSWRGLKLASPNFSGIDLRGIDLRNCDLVAADFQKANLQGADFTDGILHTTRFDAADLQGANFEYADLTDASFYGGNLQNTRLRSSIMLNTNIQNADLRQAVYLHRAFNWTLTKGWRTAQFEQGKREKLIAQYGDEVKGKRILMLLWEYYPQVIGGSWTAAYHLVRLLRKRGANITLVVPWVNQDISPYIFGNEIEVITVNGQDRKTFERLDPGYYESIDKYNPYVSTRASTVRTRKFGDYSSSYSSYSEMREQLTFFERMELFTKQALDVLDERQDQFDLIHAHDWITARTAMAISAATGIPWIFHVHSSEAERQKKPSHTVVQIEQVACEKATAICVPSTIVQKHLVQQYGVPESRILVVPNSFSDGEPSVLGDWYSKKVIFLGRFAWQKGIDIFVRLAHMVRHRENKAYFEMYGQGELTSQVKRRLYVFQRDKPVTVPPMKQQDIEHSGIDFTSLTPIQFVGKTGTIRQLRSIRDEKIESVARSILLNGFTMFPVDPSTLGRTEETVRITVKLEDGQENHYLAELTSMPIPRAVARQIVSVKGKLDWQDRYSAFDHTSVLVVPSRYEPFGMVILEAMNAGVPVVYADTSGASEFMSSGIKFPLANLEIATEQIVKLLQDQTYWTKTAEEQRQEISAYENRHYENMWQVIWDRYAKQTDVKSLAKV